LQALPLASEQPFGDGQGILCIPSSLCRLQVLPLPTQSGRPVVRSNKLYSAQNFNAVSLNSSWIGMLRILPPDLNPPAHGWLQRIFDFKPSILLQPPFSEKLAQQQVLAIGAKNIRQI
jgi:hypothetical protein